jgi:RNA polymerase sigma factor (sigma-70 family)
MLKTKSSIDQYFDTIDTDGYQPIHNEKILALIKIAQSGYDKETKTWLTEEAIEARNEILKRNVKLVAYVIHRVMKSNNPLFLDCINECNCALIKCIIGYNLEERTTNFATYVQVSIRRHAWRFLRENTSSITLPQNKVRERRIVESEIYGKSGALDRLHKRDYLPVNPVFSLDLDFDDDSVNKKFELPVHDDPSAKLGDKEIRKIVLKSLNCLTEQEKTIIEKRYLYDSISSNEDDLDKKSTLKVMALELGVSGERVRQIETIALKKMKKYITIDNGEER